MFTAERPRAVTLPPLVLGGLRPLHRQMVRNNVRAASFDHTAAGVVFDICLLRGEHEPELRVRRPDHDIAFTIAMTTHFRAVPTLPAETVRALCGIVAPGEEPTAATVVRFLHDVVAQAPAVLARTHGCAA